MLQNLIILSLSFVTIQATGEFTILSSPKSLSFEGSDAIQSHEIGELLHVSLGNPVSGYSTWSGLKIDDPFNLAKEAIIVSINGIDHSKMSAIGKTYELQGNTVEQSLNGVVTQLEAHNEPVCVFNFEQFEEATQNFKNVFGDVEILPIAKPTHLNGDLHIADQQWLGSLAYLSAIADNFQNLKKSCKLTYVSLFLDEVLKSHGKNSEAVSEAMDLASVEVEKLKAAVQEFGNNETLFALAVNQADGNSRIKRDVAPNDAKDMFNLAEYYNEDYPVIFNIILWFMVVFGFALLAICYAIGSMDPGRDSIIYRMTSTRMKKDN